MQSTAQLDTPVVFFIYHRPETTRKVFEQIKKVRPRQLFIFADGWKDQQDMARCSETRAMVETISWPCEVRRDYLVENVGDRARCTSGLNSTFERVDRAIILEDDTVPDVSFFYFCQEMLNRYYDTERVMHVGGTNFLQGLQPTSSPITGDSYYFSRLPIVWGWATWRRAWQKYDPMMKQWPETRTRLSLLSSDKKVLAVLREMFERAYRDTRLVVTPPLLGWDHQW